MTDFKQDLLDIIERKASATPASEKTQIFVTEIKAGLCDADVLAAALQAINFEVACFHGRTVYFNHRLGCWTHLTYDNIDILRKELGQRLVGVYPDGLRIAIVSIFLDSLDAVARRRQLS